MALKILILGGTAESRQLAELLSGDARYQTLLSFAGRTERLQRPASAHRVGGFGGAAGLTTFVRAQGFELLIDATHPFAARISAHAVEAARLARIPLVRLARPSWLPQPGDRWIEVADMDEAARALGSEPKRVFLTIGKQEIAAFRAAPQHDYLARAIDAFEPGLPRARVLLARGPFALADELALLQREAIELLVSKNAGTDATYAKIEAARALGLPVVMVRRPQVPPADEVGTLNELLARLSALHVASRSERGA